MHFIKYLKAGDLMNKKQLVMQVLEFHHKGYEVILPDICDLDSNFQVKKGDNPSTMYKKLCMQYKEGHKDSLLMLLLFNDPIISSLVEKYTQHFDGLNPVELEMSGLFGLIDAADNFEENIQEDFLEFCVPFIENSIQKKVLELPTLSSSPNKEIPLS